MGQRRHGQNTRKRKSIDLNSLSKKQRKLYKHGSNEPVTKKSQEQIDVQDISPPKKKKQEDVVSSSEEEDTSSYQQLVSTLVTNSSAQWAVSDDEEASDDGQSADSDEDGEQVEDVQQEETGEAVVDDSDGSEFDDSEDEDSEEEIEDQLDVGGDEDRDDNLLLETDPFVVHYERVLDEKIADELGSCKACNQQSVKVPGVGTTTYQWSHDKLKHKHTDRREKDLTKLCVKQSLCTNISQINERMCHVSVKSGQLTPFQYGMFSIINNYQDMLYTERTTQNGEEIRLLYCLHALNHILKTRKQVISHNTKLKQKSDSADDIEYRDQGLTRPKVLMVLPFRESAKRVVDMFIQLLNPTDQSMVGNKERFKTEYGTATEDKPSTGRKPEDYDSMFAGNVDDHFRIGIGVAKKTLKLYSKFYGSDIILASPLGLRTLIGAEGDRDRDYDFLHSIEVLIVDQSDVFMMQNWDHVTHLLKHLHLQPQESHGADFSRTRMWALNGWSKYYRQTLMFSSVPVPEISALFNKQCHNYAGKHTVSRKPATGCICQIAAQLPQVYHRIDTASYSQASDDRFDFFIKKVLPQHIDGVMAQALVFIPSYFDFVRIRNHCRRENINFVQANEYSKDKTVNTARNLFFHKRVPLLLYTERFHFYKRMHIRGIRHLIFYGLPQYPHYYSEMCNMLDDAKTKTSTDNLSCTVLYTKYDALKLAEVIGTERASHMIHSNKTVHMFVTGENE